MPFKPGYYIQTFSIPINQSVTKMINFAPNVWGLQKDGNYTGIVADIFNADYVKNISLDNVLTLFIDGIKYTEVDNDSDLFQNPKTFLWNDAAGLLKIRTPNGSNFWSIKEIVVGVILAFYSTNLDIDDFSGVVDGIKYQNRLLSIPNVEGRFEDVFNGKTSFIPGNVIIENSDGRYSRLNEDDNYINRFCKISSWFSDREPEITLEQESSGIISSIEVGRTINFGYNDSRSGLREKTPTRLIDTVIWTDCDSSYVIPEVWGVCRNIPLQCINENTSGSDWQLMIADVTHLDIQSIVKLFYNGAEVSAPAIQTADNVAYIEMDNTTYPDSSSFTATINGYEDELNVVIDNPLDIIQRKIKQLYDEDYNSVYYETDAWGFAYDYVFKIGYFINEQKTFSEQITEINASSGGYFEISKTTDKYTFTIIGSDLSAIISVPERRNLDSNDTNKIKYDVEKIIPVVNVGYSKRYDTDKYLILTDNSKLSELTGVVNSDNIDKTFNTLISGVTDAQRYADLILYLYGRKLRYIQKTVPMNGDTINITAGIFLSVEFDSDGFEMDYMRTFVLSYKKDYDNQLIEFSGYMFDEDVSGFKLFNDDGTLYMATFDDDGTEVNQYVI